MKKPDLYLGFGIAVLAVVLSASASLFFLPLAVPLFDCDEERRAEVESPDGRHAAQVFERDCGATTSAVTHVNLRPTAKAFDRDGSGVIHAGEVLTVTGPVRIGLVWLDNENLEIRTEGQIQGTFLAQPAWRHVNIHYAVLTR